MGLARINANSLKNKYKKIAGKRSLYNTTMNEIMFLSLAGAVCHNHGIYVETQGLRDLRIHPLIIQPSRTGKGVSLKILGQAVKWCSLTYTDEIQFTDAGLVGKINEGISEQNKKKGLTPDDEGWQDPITIGDLGNYDMVSFSEGKQMIKLSAHSDDKLEILQSIMDTPGFLRKKLSNGEAIEFISNTTVIGTTYFLDDFEKIFLEQGIFQRMFVFVRRFTQHDWDNLHELLIESPEIPDEEFDAQMKGFCQDLLTKIQSIPPGTRLHLDDSAKNYMRRKRNEWVSQIQRDFKGTELEILYSYVTSCINLFYKIAGIAAVLNGTDIITKRETNFAYNYIRKYMESIQNEVLTKISALDEGVIMQNIIRFINSTTEKDNKGIIVNAPTYQEIMDALRTRIPSLTTHRIDTVLRAMENSQEIRPLDPKVRRNKKYIRMEK